METRLRKAPEGGWSVYHDGTDLFYLGRVERIAGPSGGWWGAFDKTGRRVAEGETRADVVRLLTVLTP